MHPHDDGVKVQVRDWQSAGAIAAEEGASGIPGVTSLIDLNQGAKTNDSWLGGFASPEGAITKGSDRVRVDVFGLGAVAFYLLAGKPAASSASGLRDRLRS